MKKILFLIFTAFGSPLLSNAQSYIETIIPKTEVTDPSVFSLLSENTEVVTRQYLDGLGRKTQEIVWKGSPSKNDIVQPYSYDAGGRQTKIFLPYVSSTNDLTFRSNVEAEQLSFYTHSNGIFNNGVVKDNYPFSDVKYEFDNYAKDAEASAPGGGFQMGEGHTFITSHSGNGDLDLVRKWTLSDTGATSTLTYPAWSLMKNKTVLRDGTVVEKFTDDRGNLVCKKKIKGGTVQETHYILDEFGQLHYVVPPQAVYIMRTSNSFSLTYNGSSVTDKFVHCFKYDARGRLIERLTPDKKPEFFIYNNLNQLVAWQDGNLRLFKKWYFYKYDKWWRKVYEGILVDNRDRSVIEGEINAKPLYEETNFTGSTSIFGYTNNAYPVSVSSNGVLIVNYFDNYDYDFDNNSTTENKVKTTAQGTLNQGERTLGKMVCQKTRILETNNWLIEVYYYDELGRVIQKQFNSHKELNVSSYSSYWYDFTGKLTSEESVVAPISAAIVKTVKFYGYDHLGRLKGVSQKINNGDLINLTFFEYNELGQVKEKNLHKKASSVIPNFLQSIDYTYDIQGKLTHINNSKLNNEVGVTLANAVPLNNNNDANDLFGMELLYHQKHTDINNIPVYNGDISAFRWKIANVSMLSPEKAFKYTYDDKGMLFNSSYAENVNSSFTFGSKYNERFLYDYNGNITTLVRHNGQSARVDQLAFKYKSGNQIESVEDITKSAEGLNDINTGVDFYYDDNGNQTTNKDKNISTITYNHLNLPTRISLNTGFGDYILMTYDADGAMLSRVIYKNYSPVKTIDYVGNHYYENNVLKFIKTDEGRAVPTTTGFAYQYELKDHLGNVHITFDQDQNGLARVLQEDHYYPFGLRLQGQSYALSNEGGMNTFLFNGKESLLATNVYSAPMQDWEFYDYGARMYDPITGRWNAPDPANQFYGFTTYGSCLNNPVRYLDPDGRILPAVLLAAMLIGGAINMAINHDNIESPGDVIKYFMVGAAAGGLGAATGGAALGAMGATAAGTALGAAAAGAVGGAAGGFVGGFYNTQMQGGSFDESISAGLTGAAWGAATGFVAGGLFQGISNVRGGKNFWSGAPKNKAIGPNNVDKAKPDGSNVQTEDNYTLIDDAAAGADDAAGKTSIEVEEGKFQAVDDAGEELLNRLQVKSSGESTFGKEIAEISPRMGRDGRAVEIVFKDGSKIDINAARVKEWIPNSHPRAPAGQLQKIKFETFLDGSKGYKRIPTPGELNFLKFFD